jgi:hypothetical protein
MDLSTVVENLHASGFLGKQELNIVNFSQVDWRHIATIAVATRHQSQALTVAKI